MPETPPLFRIAANQSLPAKAKQALMIANQELGILIYREPVQIANADQRASVLHLVNTEFNCTIALPGRQRGMFYLVVFDGVPSLIPESDVLPVVWAYALAKGGIEMARRVSYRPEMLPAP
jgi:hypothetical protein